MTRSTWDRLRELAAGAAGDENWEDALLELVLAAAGPALAEALQLCAVPHWFDAGLLAAALDLPEAKAAALVSEISELSFVYPRDSDGYVFHEMVRDRLLARWREPDRAEAWRRTSQLLWTELETRLEGAAARSSALVSEAIFHQLRAEPGEGFKAWQSAYWTASFRWELARMQNLVALAEEQRQVLSSRQQGALSAASADLAANLGDRERAIEVYLHSLAIYERLEDRQNVAKITNNLGLVYAGGQDWERAIDMYSQSLAMKEELGDKHGIARTYNNLGMAYANQQRWEPAIQVYAESLASKEQLGDLQGVAQTTNNLANVYTRQGDWGRATEMYKQSLATFECLGQMQGISTARYNLACVLALQGEAAEACSWLALAIEANERFRHMAAEDEDFERIREASCFKELVLPALPA